MDVVDAAGRENREIVEYCNSVHDEAEKRLSESNELKVASKLSDYLMGKQWAANSRMGRSRPVVDRFKRLAVETIALLTDIEPDFHIKFYEDSKELQQMSDHLNKEIVNWATKIDFEAKLTQVVWWGLCGVGYSKVQWNPAMSGGYGDVEYLYLSPWNVLHIGGDRELEDSEVVIGRIPVTLESLKRKYGEKAMRIKPDTEYSGVTMARPRGISAHKWAMLNPKMKKMVGQAVEQSQSRYPTVILRDYWMKDSSINESGQSIRVGPADKNWGYIVEPGMPLYPRGRVIVEAGGVILEDMCNPYWIGRHPYSRLRLIRAPFSENGVVPLQSAAQMSDVINQIYSGVMDMVRANLEPRIIYPSNSFDKGTIDSIDVNAPGAKLAFNASGGQPIVVNGPQLPAYIAQFRQDVEREQDQGSGASAINNAMNKKQVPGGDSLEMIMSSRSGPIRLMGRNLTSYLNEVGTLVTAMKLQFENAKSRVQKYGEKGLLDADFEPYYGEFLAKGMKPEEFVRRMSLTIRRGSLLAIEKVDEVQEAFALFKLGAGSRKMVWRKLGMTEAEQQMVYEEMKQEAIEKLQLAALAASAAPHGKKKA